MILIMGMSIIKNYRRLHFLLILEPNFDVII